MTRQQLLQWSGIALAVSIVLSMAIRPPLRAGQPDSRVADFPGDIIADDSDAFKPPQPMTLAQLKVRLKLQEKHALNFPDGTTLEAVKKHLEEITRDKGDFPDGIPIYVNPMGLADADKTMESMVEMTIKGIPLGTSLSLLLDQIGLTYWVHKDGLLIITVVESADAPPVKNNKVSPSNPLEGLRSEIRALRDEIRAHHGGGTPAGSGK